MHGFLSPKQKEQVRKVASGRRVHDLGCGDCAYARLLLDWGATEVVAVDKEPFDPDPYPGLVFQQAYFEYFNSTSPAIDIAFIAWPSNYPGLGIVKLAERADMLVYLGKNTDGTACGNAELFKHFLTRELLAYVPERSNTLIVLGKRLNTPRQPCGEEFAGMNPYSMKCYGFEEAEGLAGSRSKHFTK